MIAAHHARADAADVETAHLRLAEEEAVGQQDVGDARPTIGQPLDDARLALDREDEPAAKRPELLSVCGQADIARLAAEAGEIDAEP